MKLSKRQKKPDTMGENIHIYLISDSDPKYISTFAKLKTTDHMKIWSNDIKRPSLQGVYK